MSSIILKKSSVTGKVPVTGDLTYGELALNYADGKLFYKKSDNTIQEIGTNISLKTVNNTSLIGSGNVAVQETLVSGTNIKSLNSVSLLGSGNIVTTTSGTTPPNSPTVGDIWYDTTNDIIYRYTNDGTTNYWIDVSGPVIASAYNAPVNETSTTTFTNKTISLGSNTVTGTLAQFNTAVTDADLVSITGTETITNKRVNPRVNNNGATTSGTITPTGDSSDQYEILGLTGTTTIAAPSGTPVAGQKLTLRIKDNGTARTLSWTTTSGGYRVMGGVLPTTTAASKNIYIGCIYNATDTFWDVVAIATQN